MKSDYEEFVKYIVENYDITDKNILKKYTHSARVACLMISLAKKINLEKKDIILAFQIGLFHDLGRFYEAVKNRGKDKVFDNLTFDHGAYSNHILFEEGLIHKFNVNEEDYQVIEKAVFNHNGQDIEDGLSERELLFSKMIRDMDKLDIIYVRSGGDALLLDFQENMEGMDLSWKDNIKRLGFSLEPNENLLYNYFHNQSLSLRDVIARGNTDSVILYMSYIKDLYFQESFEMAINNGYLGRLLGIIDVDDSKKELYDDLLSKIKERMKKDVREKVRSYTS